MQKTSINCLNSTILYCLSVFFQVCSYPEYEYIWNLDVCIEFYTESLSWYGSQNRCENNAGGLLVVDSFRKQSFIHPRLRRASGK